MHFIVLQIYNDNTFHQTYFHYFLRIGTNHMFSVTNNLVVQKHLTKIM